MIKALGVDMSITKQDLIDIIAQQLRDKADDEVDQALEVWTAAKQASEDYDRQRKEAAFTAACTDPRVVELIKLLESVTGSRCEVVDLSPLMKEMGYHHPLVTTYVVVASKFAENIRRGEWGYPAARPDAYVVLTNHPLITTDDDRTVELRAAVEAACVTLTAAGAKRANLDNNTQRAKVRFIKELLSVTEDGKKLLGVLNAKTASAGIRKLKVSEGESA
jgi:hypothetical protein